MKGGCMKIQVKQKGAAAIEFAIIFPIFFIIFYAVVTYGLIFAAQQTLTLAAAEGARAAVRYPAISGSSGGSTNKAAFYCGYRRFLVMRRQSQITAKLA